MPAYRVMDSSSGNVLTSGQSLANFLPITVEDQGFIPATGTKTRESDHLR